MSLTIHSHVLQYTICNACLSDMKSTSEDSRTYSPRTRARPCTTSRGITISGKPSLPAPVELALMPSTIQTGRIFSEIPVFRSCGGSVQVPLRSAQSTHHAREPHRVDDRRTGPCRRGPRTRRRRYVVRAVGGSKTRPHHSLRAISRTKYVNSYAQETYPHATFVPRSTSSLLPFLFLLLFRSLLSAFERGR